MVDVASANWANDAAMDEELPPAEDIAERLLQTAAVLGCLQSDAAPVASSPERGPRALALFNPDSPLLVATVQTPGAAGRVSQRTARRHAPAASSERLRDVQLRADARTVASLASPEAAAPLRALRHGVDPQEVVETVRRELSISETVESPEKGQEPQEIEQVDVQITDGCEHGATRSPAAGKVATDDAVLEAALLALQKDHTKVANGAAKEQAEMQTALEQATREKVEALAALDAAQRERSEAVEALEAARVDTVHTCEEALKSSKAAEIARQEVEQAKARARDETTFLEQKLGRLGSELAGWRNRSQSSEAKLAKCETERQRLEQSTESLSASVNKLEVDLKSAKAQVSTLNGMRVAAHRDLLTKKQQVASLQYDLATERGRLHDQKLAAENREIELRAKLEQAHKATNRLASLLDGTGEEEGDQWEQLRRKRDAMEDQQLADEMQYAISYRDKKIAQEALSRRHELSALADKIDHREQQLGIGTVVSAALSVLISTLSAGGSPTGLLVWIAVSLDIAAILFCSLSREMALCCRLDRMIPRMQRLVGATLAAIFALLLGIDIIPLVVAASNGSTMESWAAPGMATLRVALLSVLAASGIVSTMQRFTGSGGSRRHSSSRYRASQVHIDQGDQAHSVSIVSTQVGQVALFPAWESGTAGAPWAPRAAVHPPSLDIATLWSRSVSTHIRVYNGGNATLRVALESEAPWVHIPPSSNAPNLSIAPKTWKDMPIRVGSVTGSGTWKTAIRVFTDDPTRTEGPMEVPVQLITSAPKLRVQSDYIRIDAAPMLDGTDVTRLVRLGSDATASVTGATLLFNDGDDVLQLSKFLSNSQAARVGVARAAEPERNLPLPVFLHPGSNTAFVLTVALPANEAVSLSTTPPDGLQVVVCSSDPQNNGQTILPCRVITMQHKIQAVRTIATCIRRWQTPKVQSDVEPEAETEPVPELESSEGPDEMQRRFVMAAVHGDGKTLQELLQLDTVDANAAVMLDNRLDSEVQKSDSPTPATSPMGVDLYIPSSSTALVAAVANGHRDCFTMLVEGGVADINAADPNGNTALIMAARFGRRDAMQLLLFPPIGNGADVEQCNDEGSTAFHAACCRGDPGCVQLLLDSGCDYTRIDRQGCTGRAIAVKNGHMEIANTLREWSTHNARDSSGRTARERAIERRGDAWGMLSHEEQLLAVRREEASMAAELAEAESAFFEAAAAHRALADHAMIEDDNNMNSL